MEPVTLKYVKSNNYSSHRPKKLSACIKAWTENLRQLHKLPNEIVQ